MADKVLKSFTNSDGQPVDIVQGTGWTLQQAQRLADGDENKLAAALASLLVRVDGQPLVFEAFMDWPLADCMMAISLASEQLGNGASQGGKTS
jgi:hypothetical protein